MFVVHPPVHDIVTRAEQSQEEKTNLRTVALQRCLPLSVSRVSEAFHFLIRGGKN